MAFLIAFESPMALLEAAIPPAEEQKERSISPEDAITKLNAIFNWKDVTQVGIFSLK